MSLESAEAVVQTSLEAKYGSGKWIVGGWDVLLYLNRPLIAQKKLDLAEVQATAARALSEMPHVYRVYSHDQLLHRRTTYVDQVDRRVVDSFNADRGADLAIIPDSFWMFTNFATTHASPFSYDAQIPLLFMGPGVMPGKYAAAAAMNDIAPTLATIMGLRNPANATGRVLSEVLDTTLVQPRVARRSKQSVAAGSAQRLQ
jgi:hypothetical protein